MEIFLIFMGLAITTAIVMYVLSNMQEKPSKINNAYILKRKTNNNAICNNRRVIKPENRKTFRDEYSNTNTHTDSNDALMLNMLLMNNIVNAPDVGSDSRSDYKPSTDHYTAPIEIERTPTYHAPTYEAPSHDYGSSYDSGGSDCGSSCDCGGCD